MTHIKNEFTGFENNLILGLKLPVILSIFEVIMNFI